jgi:hypothetical protein
MHKLLLVTVVALCLSTQANAEITIGGEPVSNMPVRGENKIADYRCTVEGQIAIRSRPNGPILYRFKNGVYAYVYDKQGKWVFVEGNNKKNEDIVGAGWTYAPTLNKKSQCLKVEMLE